jgi:hypothetical protein
MNKSLLVLKIILVCLAFTPTVITYYPKLKVDMEPEEQIGCFPLIPIGYQALYGCSGSQNVMIGQ